MSSKYIDISAITNVIGNVYSNMELLDFQDKFGRNYRLASDKFKDAIKDIDDTVKKLLKVKEELLGTDNNLRLANDKLQDLTIKKLTYGNPTMKALFEEAKQESDDKDEEEN